MSAIVLLATIAGEARGEPQIDVPGEATPVPSAQPAVAPTPSTQPTVLPQGDSPDGGTSGVPAPPPIDLPLTVIPPPPSSSPPPWPSPASPASPPAWSASAPPALPGPLPSSAFGASAAASPAAAGTTTIGGYGQMDLKFTRVGFGRDFDGRANVRRVVLLVAHDWTEAIRSYVELEWENAIACASCQGVAEVEQAFLDAAVLGPNLRLRAGLILVPMGIINRMHEPPLFFSVDRPSFDQSIIPSTWRELGIGVVGRFHDIWHGELYLMTGLDPTHLGPDGIIGGRTSGVLTPVRTGALVGRIELEPWLGTVAGLSGYATDMGPNGVFYDVNRARISPHFPVLGWAFDARARKAGFELRLVAAQFFLPRSGALMQTLDVNGTPYYNPAVSGAVPNRTQGGYVELAYDVLRLAFPGTSAQLLAFARLEHYDTQAAVPAPYRPDGKNDVNELTSGLSFLPIRQIALKADFQLRDRRYGLDEMQINFGLGWLF
jgi:hypothetical protein